MSPGSQPFVYHAGVRRQDRTLSVLLLGGPEAHAKGNRGDQEPSQQQRFMSTLSGILQSGFDWVWKTSLQTSVLIILVLVFQRLLRRWLTPRLRYALSLLVLCRL